jgi:hypothetical protein
MLGAKPQQLGSDEARGSKDGNANHGRRAMRVIA